MQGLNRDRDDRGRPRNARPRDELGRPLPREAGAAPVDEPTLAPAEALERGQSLLDEGRPFTAHEVFEAVWKATPAPDRGVWKGLAQLAVGLTHRARGNDTGAIALLQRAVQTLAPYAGSTPHGIAVDRIRDWARSAATSAAPGDVPRLTDQAAEARD